MGSASAAAGRPGLLTRKKGSFMKSRVALVAVLALGVFMSGTGATLAVSGFSGSASSTQYGPIHHKSHHVVEAASAEGEACSSGGSGNGGANTGTSGENCVEVAPVETQAVQQVAATSESGSSLPFTGFVAIPVLLVGLGLLGAGVAMRMRLRRGDHVA
jgi:hypothetical protein